MIEPDFGTHTPESWHAHPTRRPVRPGWLKMMYAVVIAGAALRAATLFLPIELAALAHLLFLALLVVIGLVLYFLPFIIATQRDHRNTIAIALLNLFLGWTLLGWVAALCWAVYREK